VEAIAEMRPRVHYTPAPESMRALAELTEMRRERDAAIERAEDGESQARIWRIQYDFMHGMFKRALRTATDTAFAYNEVAGERNELREERDRLRDEIDALQAELAEVRVEASMQTSEVTRRLRERVAEQDDVIAGMSLYIERVEGQRNRLHRKLDYTARELIDAERRLADSETSVGGLARAWWNTLDVTAKLAADLRVARTVGWVAALLLIAATIMLVRGGL
jgi:chromosome segregation ATPase